jgi:hypothetical protein
MGLWGTFLIQTISARYLLDKDKKKVYFIVESWTLPLFVHLWLRT